MSKFQSKKEESDKFYKILGINRESRPDEIRKAYKKLAAKMHPDKGGEQEKVDLF